ncbi:proteasome-activating nucleotidase [[Eubacterium] cellulosolvens]
MSDSKEETKKDDAEDFDLDEEEEDLDEDDLDDAQSSARTQYNPWKEVAIRAESDRRSIENELIKLQKEVQQLYQELKKLKSPPLIIGEIVDILDDDRVVVKSTTGPNFVVHVANFVDKSKVQVGTRVSLNRDSLSVIGILAPSKDPIISEAEVIERPTIKYEDIGGLEPQIEEIKEVVELPLIKPELFRKVGIDPPTGVLLIGPPGTGKTLLAQAVAQETNATFIRLVGSELVQKYIGEGGRLVRELFALAKEKAPSIIFIDELDAIAARRVDSGTSADREVQRTLMQLLAELDGFDPLKNVRIIAASNRPDVLDPALLRPGRFDRIIDVPLPTYEARLEILFIHTRRMNLRKEVSLEDIASKTDGMSGADLKAICTEAGMFAIRERRHSISKHNFQQAFEKIKKGDSLSQIKEMGAMFA